MLSVLIVACDNRPDLHETASRLWKEWVGTARLTDTKIDIYDGPAPEGPQAFLSWILQSREGFTDYDAVYHVDTDVIPVPKAELRREDFEIPEWAVLKARTCRHQGLIRQKAHLMGLGRLMWQDFANMGVAGYNPSVDQERRDALVEHVLKHPKCRWEEPLVEIKLKSSARHRAELTPRLNHDPAICRHTHAAARLAWLGVGFLHFGGTPNKRWCVNTAKELYGMDLSGLL